MADVEIVQVDDGTADRFHAALVQGGVPWSFSCGHLHHTAGKAGGCLRAIQTAWDSIRGDVDAALVESFRPDVAGLVELRWTRSDGRAMSQRLRERPDWIRVETPGHGGPDRGTVST